MKSMPSQRSRYSLGGTRVAAHGSFIWTIWAISLLLHIFTGWNSAGIVHPDEHFQIFEFINYKFGNISDQSLPWEFGTRMRSWLLPGLFYWLAKVISLVKGTWDPFLIARASRIAMAVVGWASLVKLWKWFIPGQARNEFRSLLCAAILAFFYFHLFLHARTLSENFAGSLFILGLTALSNEPISLTRALCSGVLLGLSFETRFQMAFALVGVIAWLFWVRRVPIRVVMMGCLGFSGVLLSAAVIDHWGYGEWCFPPWNYFIQNVVLGKASNWGTAPPWYYFQSYLRELPLGMGAFLLLGWLSLWICIPFHPISLASLAFILAHSAVAHKEARFLYPMIPFAVLGLFVSAEKWGNLISSKLSQVVKTWGGYAARVLILFYVLVNLFLVLRTCFSPFSTGLLVMEEVFHRSSPVDNVILFDREDPGAFFKFEQTFYTPRPLRRIKVAKMSLDETELKNFMNKGTKLFLYTKQTRGELKNLVEGKGNCQTVATLADDAGLAVLIPLIPSVIQDSVEVRQLWDCNMNSVL